MSTDPFTLLLPVYGGDDPDFLRRAFHSSVDEQTLAPDEVVLVQDGPVGDELADTLTELIEVSPVPVRLVVQETNRGLAEALEAGLAEASHEIVARMDADDISLPQRFERQLPLVLAGADLVGTGMVEFETEHGPIVGRREPRTGQDAIAAYARFHDPFSHPTVMYRRRAVAAAGGYEALGQMEDYWLFARMIAAGARVENVAEALVKYRVGAGAYARRGGMVQWRSERMLQRALRTSGFTTRGQHVRNLVVRGVYRFVPERMRRWAYRRWIARGRA